MKKLISLLLTAVMLFPSFAVFAKDYDEEGIYRECYTLYPDFVDRVKAQGVSDKQIIRFLSSVEEYLLSLDDLTEENFDDNMFASIKYAFGLLKNIKVRDALSAAYPEAVPKAAEGVVPPEFMPIYITVKRLILGIYTPVVTLSLKKQASQTVIYPHFVHIEDNTNLILALYDSCGSLIRIQRIAPDNPDCAVILDGTDIFSAKLFAWDANMSPVCDSYELITE